MSLFNRDRWGWLIPRAPEKRMYRRSALPTLLVIVCLLLVLQHAKGIASLPLRAAFALSPLLFYLWVFREYLRYLGECDELERRIELESIAFAAMFALFLMLGMVLLSSVGALAPSFDAADATAVAAVGVAAVYALVRYFLLWRAW